MAEAETIRGTIVFILRREGQEPVVFELELRLANGSQRLVRVADEVGRTLREGENVEATGRVDANQVLVATSIRPVTTAPPPPPAPRGAPWLLLATPAMATATLWLVVYSVEEGVFSRTLWMLAGAAAVAVAQLKAVGGRARIVLRTIGGTALVAALVYRDSSDALLVLLLLVLLLVLTLVAGVLAIVLFLRSAAARKTGAAPPASQP